MKIFLGSQAGTVLALSISGTLADEVGWESVFYFCGIQGIAWFLFWAFFCFNSPETHPRISKVQKCNDKISLNLNNKSMLLFLLGWRIFHHQKYSFEKSRFKVAIPSTGINFQEYAIHCPTYGRFWMELGLDYVDVWNTIISKQYSTFCTRRGNLGFYT